MKRQPSSQIDRPLENSRRVQRQTQGIALVATLIFMAVMTAVLTVSVTLSTSELRTNRNSQNSVQGFYAAEGGLNLRAERVRDIFKGYRRPVGTAPLTGGGNIPCVGNNIGLGDMACQIYTIGGRSVRTYMTDVTKYSGGNPETGVVEPGDVYAGLNYAQYAYVVRSEAWTAGGQREAVLEMKFQSRLVPLFQFAAFYSDDLEFHPGPPMTLNGRVHTNKNLYLNAGNTLDINGKTTAAQTINRFGKDGRGCAGTVRFFGTAMPCNDTLDDTELSIFGGNVLARQAALTVPPMSSLNPDPTGANNSELWNRADIRIVARRVAVSVLNPSGFELNVVLSDGTVDATATAALRADNLVNLLDPTVQVRPNSFWDARENKWLTMLDVDQQRLMNLIQISGAFRDANGGVLRVDDATSGGLAIHLSFEDGDPRTNGNVPFLTNYAVMLHNAARLGTSTGTPPLVGLTVATNQQLFTRGDYNRDNKRPAALLADTINVLSNAVSTDIKQSYVNRAGQTVTGGFGPVATPTTVNAALLSGIDTTVGTTYNGGLQNYTRFHEDWGNNTTFTYRGSFVSLGNSVHVNGPQSRTRYQPPQRDWNYDSAFNDANNLPPLTPRFVYLRQLLFARTW